MASGDEPQIGGQEHLITGREPMLGGKQPPKPAWYDRLTPPFVRQWIERRAEEARQKMIDNVLGLTDEHRAAVIAISERYPVGLAGLWETGRFVASYVNANNIEAWSQYVERIAAAHTIAPMIDLDSLAHWICSGDEQRLNGFGITDQSLGALIGDNVDVS